MEKKQILRDRVPLLGAGSLIILNPVLRKKFNIKEVPVFNINSIKVPSVFSSLIIQTLVKRGDIVLNEEQILSVISLSDTDSYYSNEEWQIIDEN